MLAQLQGSSRNTTAKTLNTTATHFKRDAPAAKVQEQLTDAHRQVMHTMRTLQ